VGNGELLRALAVGHALVGVLVYRKELREIGTAGVVAAVPYRGPRATAFWFLVPSALTWIIGGLTRRAERAGDAEALRDASRASALVATVAIICVPVSGFWAWLAISLRGLQLARRLAGPSATAASRSPVPGGA